MAKVVLRGGAMRVGDLRRRLIWAMGLVAPACLLASAAPAVALAQDAPSAPFSLGLRETADLWDNAAGGVRTGSVVLNKLQVTGSLDGAALGLPGVSAHVQIFRTDGASLSRRVGDIQTVSNIEANTTTRLFEAWVEKTFGDDDRSLSFRAGLMDLNADFDAIDPAGVFINSSHGIGPDLSRSGLNGPSIFPVSSLGLRASWSPDKSWTFKGAVFDGVSGAPADPAAFAKVRLARSDGVLVIGQVDYHLAEKTSLEVGAWGYSQPLPAVNGNPTLAGRDQGLYASLAGPIPKASGWSGWLRAGTANDVSQVVDGYFGAGIVRSGPFESRPDDQLGFAVGSAQISAPARAALRLKRAETTFETTYLFPVSPRFAVQPDVQYVIDPAGHSGARNALVLGGRFVITAGDGK